jgi:hypothetical protein
MVERPPVVGDEVSGVESLKKRQCVTARHVPFAESRLPPRRMLNRQESQIQAPSIRAEVVL